MGAGPDFQDLGQQHQEVFMALCLGGDFSVFCRTEYICDSTLPDHSVHFGP